MLKSRYCMSLYAQTFGFTKLNSRRPLASTATGQERKGEEEAAFKTSDLSGGFTSIGFERSAKYFPFRSQQAEGAKGEKHSKQRQ